MTAWFFLQAAKYCGRIRDHAQEIISVQQYHRYLYQATGMLMISQLWLIHLILEYIIKINSYLKSTIIVISHLFAISGAILIIVSVSTLKQPQK